MQQLELAFVAAELFYLSQDEFVFEPVKPVEWIKIDLLLEKQWKPFKIKTDSSLPPGSVQFKYGDDIVGELSGIKK